MITFIVLFVCAALCLIGFVAFKDFAFFTLFAWVGMVVGLVLALILSWFMPELLQQWAAGLNISIWDMGAAPLATIGGIVGIMASREYINF